MNITVSKTALSLRDVVIDLFILGLVCLIPSVSHAVAFPLYRLNPMLLCLLGSMLLVGNRANAYVLAVLMPTVSMLVTGMPLFSNYVCMVPELLVTVGLLTFMERRTNVFVATVVAAVVGKVVFYSLRAMLFAPAVLVGTSVWLQLAVIVVAAGLFWKAESKSPAR